MPVRNGIVHAEPGFQVRAVLLDHHTPVLAYTFEPDCERNVRKDALQRLGLAPGGWLNELKQRYLEHDHAAYVDLPDGNRVSVGELAPELLAITPGRRLVYATDLADTTANRTRLVELARNAHTLFLEAVFTEADVARARAHDHLTARACGEIADTAAVARRVPFHFSRRYADDLTVVIDEIEAVCRCTVRPGPQVLDAATASGEGAAQHDADYSVERKVS